MGYALSTPLSFPRASCSLLKQSFGPHWWDDQWALYRACLASTMQLIYLSVLHCRCEKPLLKSRNMAPATLLLEFCAFLMGGSTLLSTFLLEHCLSLEKAPGLSSSGSPVPPQRQHLLSPPCRWELWATQRWSSTSDTQGKYSQYSMWLSHIASSSIDGFYAPCTQVHWLHRF